MVKIFCGSVAESVTSTTNVVYVRFYSEKNGLESRFDSIFTAMRALDSGVIADSCDPEVSFYFAGVPPAHYGPNGFKTSGNLHFRVNITDFGFNGFNTSIWVPLSPLGPQKSL